MKGSTTQKKDLEIEEAKDIGAVYKLLSRVFIREVDDRFLRELKTECFQESLISAGINLGDEFLNQDTERLLENLAVEYARLFIVPVYGYISTYESVYIEERLLGESTCQVSRFYEKCGLGLHNKDIMADHIGLELELMSYLKQKEVTARQNGNQDTNNKWLELQKEFITQHLDKWAPQFFALVENTAIHPFYKEMARLGRQLIKIDSNKTRKTVKH